MNKQPFYITTPIYYMSNKLHIGNAYCTVCADSMARYKRLRGYDVQFLTGTDDHGQKVERMAENAGKTPQDFVDGLAELSKELWTAMNCEYDIFMRTTADFHIKACQKLFKKLYEQGDIYKSTYEGLYCVWCETFFTPKNAPDGLCADCGRKLEAVREECYFFKQSKYADALLEHIDKNPEFIQPEFMKNEMVSFLKSGLEDIAVTRTTIKWGIPVDFDPKHVIYVWFDALPNYATALGLFGEDDSMYKKYWPVDYHLVGKDILRFHTILWPAMLLALGEPLPKAVFGTGWLTIDGAKMSKSVGNVVDPIELSAKYGTDAIRYFLMREMALGRDGNYTEQALVTRINADLANDLGNLLSRTVGMIFKYFDGKLPKEQKATSFDSSLILTMKDTVIKAELSMDKFAFSEALTDIWAMVRRANKYVDETEPWLLYKHKEMGALARVLYMLLEVLRHTAIMVSPVMPTISAEIFRQTGVTDKKLMGWEGLEFGINSGEIEVIKGEALFPRIDVEKALAVADNAASAEVPLKPQITMDDFSKLDLRVGIIKESVKISEKLLKNQVDVGGKIVQILSGIAEWYTPEDMVGKKVVVVTNLKPIKLRGQMSEGMILAAGEDAVKLVTIDGDADAGTGVR